MLILTTVDDVPGEAIPYVIERTLETGANNVHVVNAVTKKGRTEYMVFVDVDEKRLDDVCAVLALEFGTLGFKILESRHKMLPYEKRVKTVRISVGGNIIDADVSVKYLLKDGKAISLKAEYEDVKSLATRLADEGTPVAFSRLKALIEAEAFSRVLESSDAAIEIKNDTSEAIRELS
jgi:uncharacterized protein (DUF111 family)